MNAKNVNFWDKRWRGKPAALIAGLFLAAGVACSKKTEAPPPAPPKVTVAHPETRTLVDEDNYNGWLEAAENVDVRSRVRGHIAKIGFTDGQIVKKGDLLFQLDPRPFEAEVGQARDRAPGRTSAESRRGSGLRANETTGRRRRGQQDRSR